VQQSPAPQSVLLAHAVGGSALAEPARPEPTLPVLAEPSLLAEPPLLLLAEPLLLFAPLAELPAEPRGEPLPLLTPPVPVGDPPPLVSSAPAAPALSSPAAPALRVAHDPALPTPAPP
jgi:hypothetical protein